MSARPKDGPVAAPAPPAPAPTAEAWDSSALSILTAEHASLASARSLAYNEAFTRIGNFLSFLSLSFVALALIAPATSFGTTFLAIAAVALTFDLVIGLATFGRILGTTSDDLRAVQGMARVRNGYLRIAPHLEPYFSDGTTDDLAGVMRTYRDPGRGPAAGLYALTTSTGMTGMINALLGGLLAGVLALLVGVAVELAVVLGAIFTVVVLAIHGAAAARYFVRDQTGLEVRFPSRDQASPRDEASG
jgi:lysylphosphatidylglycerol synthetase-like protein (DUF2156 family)